MAPPSLISLVSRTSTTMRFFFFASNFFFSSGIAIRSAGTMRVLRYNETTMIHDWMRMLLAILAGNLIYLLAEPILPDALAHGIYKLDAGLILDFAICAGIYLL